MSETVAMSVSDLYALLLREAGRNPDAVGLSLRGLRWAMDLDAYKQLRAACRAAGAVYPEGDDPDDWVPGPDDRLFGLPIEVRDYAGAPHLEPLPLRSEPPRPHHEHDLGGEADEGRQQRGQHEGTHLGQQ